MRSIDPNTLYRSRLNTLLLWPLGYQIQGIALANSGLSVLSRTKTELPFDEIDRPLRTERTLGRPTIVATTKSGTLFKVVGLRKSQAEEFILLANAAWRQHFIDSVERIAPDLVNLAEAVARLDLPKRFPSACLLQPFVERANSIIDALPSDIPQGILPSELQTALDRVMEFQRDPHRARDAAIKVFIDTHLHQFEEFFDNIETNPLTPEQRLAVVTDEDATLVLAGAGSGKTSVIVAKAAYLIESGIRQPNEILLLAFGKDAAAEMATRIEERAGAKVDALTFHALGNSIIRQVESGAPALAAHASDEKQFTAHLRDILFNDIAVQPELGALLLRWFSEFYWPYKSEWDFKTKDEYYQYVEAHELRTLQGELVKSFEEWEIANWLYLNGIAYEYEPNYEHDLPENDRTAYTPDFRLIESGVYIEHFGVRKSVGANGQAELTTAPHVNRKEYLEGMEWKRKVHSENETILIETFSYERVEGRLTEALEEKLAPYATLAPIPPEQVFEQLSEMGQVDAFTQVLGTFLRHFKSSGTNILECLERAKKSRDKARGAAFLKVFEPVLEAYQDRLGERIDFEDMIVRATEHVKAGRYKSPYRHLLVDEFQDISDGRAKLLNALKAQHKDARIFAVGDDWQSIFRFTGSDIHLMRNFGNEFGGVFAGASDVHCSVDLGRTFRSVDKIALPARTFVLQNSSQISKTVIPAGTSENPAISVTYYVWGKKFDALQSALEQIEIAANGSNASVLLLGRYNFLAPEELPQLNKRFRNLSLTFMTIHRSKGLEADHVVILGAASGRMGFPSEIVDDPLLELVLPEPEEYDHAEERRLFYVALTRARKSVTILADRQRPSAFVRELISNPEYGVIERGEPGIALRKCFECGGRMLARTSKKGKTYFQCEHRKQCGAKLWPCDECGTDLPIQDTANANTLSCTCGATYPACPECTDGWLVERKGKWGTFLGCIKYPDCTGKMRIPIETQGPHQSDPDNRTPQNLSPIKSGAADDTNAHHAKNVEQQDLQKLLDEGQIKSVKELESYVAARQWSFKRTRQMAHDGRYMIGIRIAPYVIFRVETEFDPSSVNIPRSKHGRVNQR